MEDSGPGRGYGGSRAEWILKRANDFDAKARSFLCCRCSSPAVWVCLDPVCVAHNGSSVLCLCNECDQRFHPGSNPVMCRHRRLAMVLYISLIMLYRYQKIVEFISALQQDTGGGQSAPSLTVPEEVSSTQGDVSTNSAPQAVAEVEVVTEKAIVESPVVASLVAPTTSPSQIDATSSLPNNQRSADVASSGQKTTPASTGNNQSLKDDLRSIHESYAGVLGHMRRDKSLSLPDACRREPRGKLTVKSYAAIAELNLLDPELYQDTLAEFQRRQNGSGTLSSFERDCSAVLTAYSQRVADMRQRMELLPCFNS